MMMWSDISWQWWDVAVLIVLFVAATEYIYFRTIRSDVRRGLTAKNWLGRNKLGAILVGAFATFFGGIVYAMARSLEAHEQWILGAAAVVVCLVYGFFKVNEILGERYILSLEAAEKKARKKKR